MNESQGSIYKSYNTQIPIEYRRMKPEKLQMLLKKLDNDMAAEIETIKERYLRRKDPILKALELLNEMWSSQKLN